MFEGNTTVCPSLLRAALLIVFVMCLMAIGSINAKTQQSDDVGALNQQATQLYGAGKYAEYTDIVQHALALAERQFGPNHTNVATELYLLGKLHRVQGRYAEANLFARQKSGVNQEINESS